MTSPQHFCDSLRLKFIAVALFKVFFTWHLCSKSLARSPGKPHSDLLLQRSNRFHCFLIADSKVCVCVWSVLWRFPSLLPLLALVLTALVKGYYNLQEEPAMHLGKIKKQPCLTLPGLNSDVKWLFGLHTSPHKYIHMAARFFSVRRTQGKL